MPHHGKSRLGLAGPTIAVFVAAAVIGLSHGTLAATSGKHPHRAATSAAKCLCGYGISGYEAITCVPVKDCEWEHATCRGTC